MAPVEIWDDGKVFRKVNAGRAGLVSKRGEKTIVAVEGKKYGGSMVSSNNVILAITRHYFGQRTPILPGEEIKEGGLVFKGR